jgi:hypothetical protein
LCGYSGNLHKPYGEYLKRLEASKSGEDMFSGVGGVATKSSNVIENKKDEVDLSWLNNI